MQDISTVQLAPNSILSIIPIYHPDPGCLLQLVYKLTSFDISILLVANSHLEISLCQDFPDSVQIERLVGNMGTAYAYNVGIRYSLATDSVKYLLFFDQDSMPSDTYLEFCLRKSLNFGHPDGENAVYCPSDNKNVRLKSKYHNISTVSNYLDIELKLREVFDAKASGLLLSREVAQRFRFDERLYVDYVDWEYCWRIRAAGVRLFELSSVYLDSHSLGNSYKVRFIQKVIYLPSATRRTIQTRSALYLLARCMKFKCAPRIRLISIASRVVINPFLDLLETIGMIYEN